MRVLIADDREVIREGVRLILSSELDIELFEVSNGKEAISKTLELLPDLVILDLTMPVMGGYAAAQELRKLVPHIPILVLTIHEGASLVEEAGGVRGFVHKREAGQTLIDAVYELVLRKGTPFPELVQRA